MEVGASNYLPKAREDPGCGDWEEETGHEQWLGGSGEWGFFLVAEAVDLSGEPVSRERSPLRSLRAGKDRL